MSQCSCLTVLIIDDCAQDWVTFRQCLQHDSLYSYRIVEFVTATEAIAWCRQGRANIPDIILVNFLLPDGNGLELLAELTKVLNYTRTAIILLTEQENAGIAVRAMKNGAQDYLVKDQITPETLQASIHDAVKDKHRLWQLEQSREQKQLITAIALGIRGSLKLKEILAVTAQQVRQFLDTDRVVVYQFNSDMSGTVVSESVLPGWTVSLKQHISDTCFQQQAGAEYRQGKTRAINNIYEAGLTDCHVQLLEQFEVKANLVVPILVRNHLWGLLIAHECTAPREWDALELELLEQLAVQIAIAIQQATAYQMAQIQLKQRKRTEKTLRETVARFRSTFEQAAVGIGHVSLNGQFLRVNQRFADITGYRQSQLMKLRFQEITHPEDLAADLQQLEMLEAGAIQTYSMDKRYIRKDGTIVWIKLTVSLVRDARNHPQYLITVIEDISHRKQAEQALQQLNQELEARVEQRTAALRESEQRWQLVLQGSNDGIKDWDISKNEVFFSTRWKQMRGFADDEISNKLEEWSSRIHADDYDLVMQTLADHFAQKTPFFQQEYRVKHKDGSYIWILDRGQALWDDAGNVIRMSGSETDITERKRNEEKLRNLSDRLTLALQAGEIGTWDWDLVHDPEWDDRIYELYGMQRPQIPLTYKDWRNKVYPDDLAEVEAAFEAAVRREKDYNQEFRVVHPDGSIHFIRAAAIIQRDLQGKAQRMVGINYDITERKKIELALKESERRYATLTEAAPVAIFQVNSAGNCIYANDFWSQLTGRPAAAALGRGWVETLHPEDRDRILTEWSEWYKSPHPGLLYHNEGRCLHPDGTITWFYCQSLAEIDEEGKIIGYIGTLTDITELKQAEAELQHTNEELSKANIDLARATRLKDEFLANMSHELRTPLNAILGMSEGLEEGVFGEINSQQAKAIATIKGSGRHLLELINDILDLAKIESGKLELQLSDVDTKSLCENSLMFIKHMALNKNIRLITDIPDHLGTIQADNRRLRQVLINLLSNAVKFTPQGGMVTLKVWLEGAGEQGSRGAEGAGEQGSRGSRGAGEQGSRGSRGAEGVEGVDSPLSSPVSHINFSVSDTGIGIAPQDMGKLFQPFSQIDSSLNRQYEGTGLGLALVKRITVLHGGTVSVSSQVGEGSCFTIHIPYLTKDSVPRKQVIEHLPKNYLLTDNRLVLIIEDVIAAAEQITRYLSEMQMKCVIYAQGEGAVEEVMRLRPGLIILDLQLANLSGWDVLKQLKLNPQTKDIPVLIISVMDEHIKGLAEGAFAYLVKPITREQLRATLEQGKSAVCPEFAGVNLVAKQTLASALILLVEDNQANIDTMSGYLENRGYRLAIAHNGEEAIEQVYAENPDLIVMDIQMPKMDGLEAIRRIRDDKQFVDVPIIALTALAMAGDRETCLAAGANEYLSKPVKLKQLVATIEKLLR